VAGIVRDLPVVIRLHDGDTEASIRATGDFAASVGSDCLEFCSEWSDSDVTSGTSDSLAE
jgi:hypothetical protein